MIRDAPPSVLKEIRSMDQKAEEQEEEYVETKREVERIEKKKGMEKKI